MKYIVKYLTILKSFIIPALFTGLGFMVSDSLIAIYKDLKYLFLHFSGQNMFTTELFLSLLKPTIAFLVGAFFLYLIIGFGAYFYGKTIKVIENYDHP